MRVSIIHPHLFVRGGGERLTKILAAGLEKLGDEVSITTSSLKGGFLELNRPRTVFFFKNCPIPLRSVTLKNLAELALSINETLRRFDPDVIVSMTEDAVNLGFSKLLKRELKSIQYVHFPFEEEACFSNLYGNYHRFPSWFNKRFLWAANLILCNSKYTQTAIDSAWKKTAHVVYPAIDHPFMKIPKNLDKPRENLVLCVGRFTRLKRQDFLVRAFSQVKEKVKNARLILAGYPDSRHSHFLKSLLNPGEEGVEIRLNPSDSELIELYSSAKVYCHPRIAEHFGLSPLEAMSQGAPVVAYNKGGTRETIIHGETGYLAQSDQEFIQYIIEVLQLPHREWVRLQRRAVERAHSFSPDRFVQDFRTCALPGSTSC